MPSKLPALGNEVLQAYDYCRDVTKREAKNWYYGFISMPPDFPGRLRELLDNPTETSWQTTPSTS